MGYTAHQATRAGTMESTPPDNPILPEEAPARPDDPRSRMAELRRIPERNRTDAQWDELNDLEIRFAPGNRVGSAPQDNNAGRSRAPGPRPSGQSPPKPRSNGKGRFPRPRQAPNPK